MGRCPDCEQWDSLVEEVARADADSARRPAGPPNAPVSIAQAAPSHEERMRTGILEFDRVMGGGLVVGSLVLIGGDPGIGKSTLMLQALHGLAGRGRKVLYVSGEESVRQLMIRSRRLETQAEDLWVVSETDVDAILAMAAAHEPDVLVVDSIQTLFSPQISSTPGSVSQVRDAAMRLMLMAKGSNTSVFLVGHVTKDGAIAGPRLLEHMVDSVLYFEGDRNHVFRILRAVKNRFGSTNEIGVFEMKAQGLMEVANPSAVFISERPERAAGSIVTASVEGSRPILVELQALVSSTNYGTPRRTILGLDANRVALLVAVMEKKLGMNLLSHDIFLNVAGGVKIDEPAVDMGVVAAVASSFLDRPVQSGAVVLGEVGLTGEIRAISHVDTRVAELKKMGFTRCLLPRGNLARMAPVEGIALEGVGGVAEAVELLF